MPDAQPSPEQRAAQRDTWKRAQAAWNAARRNQRGKKKTAQVKAGMHRKSADPKT